MKKYKICEILLVILAIFLCVAFYELIGICVAYKKQPEVSNTTKKETKNGSGIVVNSRDPLRDYTDMLSFGTLSQSDRGILSQYVTIFDPNLSSVSCQIPSHEFASIFSLGVTCFSTRKAPHSNLGTRFF